MSQARHHQSDLLLDAPSLPSAGIGSGGVEGRLHEEVQDLPRGTREQRPDLEQIHARRRRGAEPRGLNAHGSENDTARTSLRWTHSSPMCALRLSSEWTGSPAASRASRGDRRRERQLTTRRARVAHRPETRAAWHSSFRVAALQLRCRFHSRFRVAQQHPSWVCRRLLACAPISSIMSTTSLRITSDESPEQALP